MNKAELPQEIAVMLFQKENLTLAQFSRLAGMSRMDFQQLLASRRISVHYDVDDLHENVETLRNLGQFD